MEILKKEWKLTTPYVVEELQVGSCSEHSWFDSSGWSEGWRVNNYIVLSYRGLVRMIYAEKEGEWICSGEDAQVGKGLGW